MPAYLYMVGGMDMGARRASGTSARKRAAPKPADAAAEVAEPAENAALQRRRRRTKIGMRGRGHEYMDLDQDLALDPVAVPSGRGAGPLGFTSAAQRLGTAQPAGLTALAEDGFGGGAVSPMIPNTWPADG